MVGTENVSEFISSAASLGNESAFAERKKAADDILFSSLYLSPNFARVSFTSRCYFQPETLS